MCGDGICTAEKDETCNSCPADCCEPFPIGATIGIVSFCVIFSATISIGIGVSIIIIILAIVRGAK